MSPKLRVVWKKLAVQTKAQLLAVTRAPNDRVWIVGAKGTVRAGLVRDDTWSAVDVGCASSFHCVVAARDGTIWIWGEAGTLLRGDDGGTRWSMKSPIPGSIHAVAGVVVEGDVVVVADTEGLVHRSEDRGDHWTAVTVAPHAKTDPAAYRWGLTALARGEGDTLYAVGLGAILLVSHDLGRTFSTRDPGGDPALSAVASAGDDLWAVGMDRVLRGPANGDERLVYAGPKRERDATYTGVAIADGAVCVSNWNRVLRSYDRGDTWELLYEKTCLANALVAFSRTEAIVVGSDGLAMVCRDR